MPNFLGWSAHLLKTSPLASRKSASSATAANAIDGTTFSGANTTATIGGGLLYLKGGEFTDELQAACIDSQHISRQPVCDLLPGLSSDKFVLYVPQHEIYESRLRTDRFAQIK